MTRHGSWATYHSGRCHSGPDGRPCETCATAHASWKRARRQRLLDDPSLAQHGTIGTYCNWMCRCPECSAAWTKYQADHYDRTHPKMTFQEWMSA